MRCMDDFLSLAESRRSIRSFSPSPLDWGDVIDLVRAASYAPSAGDLQPWRFVVLTDRDVRARIVAECPQQEWLGNAPLLLVVVSDLQKSVEFYGDRADAWTLLSIGAAVQNLLLEAKEKGIGACWVGSFNAPNVRDILKVPDGYEISAVLGLGKPLEDPQPRAVQPLDAMIYFNAFGTRQESMAGVLRDYGEIVQRKRQDLQQTVSEKREGFRAPARVEQIGQNAWEHVRTFFRGRK